MDSSCVSLLMCRWAFDRVTCASVLAVVEVESCDLDIKNNSRSHHTELFGEERLIVRRGQPFNIVLHLKPSSKEFKANETRFTFIVETGGLLRLCVSSHAFMCKGVFHEVKVSSCVCCLITMFPGKAAVKLTLLLVLLCALIDLQPDSLLELQSNHHNHRHVSAQLISCTDTVSPLCSH